MTCLLASTYFGPIQWYQKLANYDNILMEVNDSYRKQTYRNRCIIATTAGLQTLSVPIERQSDPKARMKDIRISNHGNWRHLHWNALMSAYGESPFFFYYADNLRPFFEKRWDHLLDFNMEICHAVCDMLDLNPNIRLTEAYVPATSLRDVQDFRDSIDPKHPGVDTEFEPRRYWQVYERKIGFRPNLSILDLLFNMGPEGIFYLIKPQTTNGA